MIDHAALLQKYLAHVLEAEGVNLLQPGSHSEVIFSDEETAELERLTELAAVTVGRG